MSAKARSIGVRPARASIRNATASALSIASSVCATIRLVSEPGAASSKPAVATTVKERSPRRACPSRRSRVTPGRSSTSASRLPTKRLNRVDLPTFGRPTMARVKVMTHLLCRDAGRNRCPTFPGIAPETLARRGWPGARRGRRIGRPGGLRTRHGLRAAGALAHRLAGPSRRRRLLDLLLRLLLRLLLLLLLPRLTGSRGRGRGFLRLRLYRLCRNDR